MNKNTLREKCLFYFDYDGRSLVWKNITSNRVKSGSIAGVLNSNGYMRVQVDGDKYYAHQLVYLMHFGVIPKMIDHVDGNKLNNNIGNLRRSCHKTNGRNRGKNKNNTSGYKNVFLDKRSGGWYAQIAHSGKKEAGPLRKSVYEANADAIALREKYHREYSNHG